MSTKYSGQTIWASNPPPCRDGSKLGKLWKFSATKRRESCGGMAWLGVWNCYFSGSEFSNFSSLKLGENRSRSAEFQGFSWKIRPLKNIFRSLENGHSMRHQSIPPLSAGRINLKTLAFSPLPLPGGRGDRNPNFVDRDPKFGPFHTKNAMALESAVFCYHRSLSLSIPFPAPFPLEKQSFLSTLRTV